jgi:hypothetical protein
MRDYLPLLNFTESTLDILRRTEESEIPVIDLQDLMARFTMDSASEFMFGKCLETLKGRRPQPGTAKLGIKGSAYASGEEDQFGDFASGVYAFHTTCLSRPSRRQILSI